MGNQGGYHSNLQAEIKGMLNQERSMTSAIPNSNIQRPITMNTDFTQKNQKYQKRVDGILGRLNDMQVDIEKDK